MKLHFLKLSTKTLGNGISNCVIPEKYEISRKTLVIFFDSISFILGVLYFMRL